MYVGMLISYRRDQQSWKYGCGLPPWLVIYSYYNIIISDTHK